MSAAAVPESSGAARARLVSHHAADHRAGAVHQRLAEAGAKIGGDIEASSRASNGIYGTET